MLKLAEKSCLQDVPRLKFTIFELKNIAHGAETSVKHSKQALIIVFDRIAAIAVNCDSKYSFLALNMATCTVQYMYLYSGCKKIRKQTVGQRKILVDVPV